VCMILLSGAPSMYNPPYEVYYTFAPVAGFVCSILAVARESSRADSLLLGIYRICAFGLGNTRWHTAPRYNRRGPRRRLCWALFSIPESLQFATAD
jgi:hypothetical protein